MNVLFELRTNLTSSGLTGCDIWPIKECTSWPWRNELYTPFTNCHCDQKKDLLCDPKEMNSQMVSVTPEKMYFMTSRRLYSVTSVRMYSVTLLALMCLLQFTAPESCCQVIICSVILYVCIRIFSLCANYILIRKKYLTSGI